MSQYRVIIASLDKEGVNPKTIYEQVVDDLDTKLVITAVNSTPKVNPEAKPIRRRAQRSDKGKPRQVVVTENV
jgi:hypothetical protein